MGTTINNLSQTEFVEVAQYYGWRNYHLNWGNDRTSKIYLDNEGMPEAWDCQKANNYPNNKQLSFYEWKILKNQLYKNKETNMKYCVEISNKAEFEAVIKHVGNPYNVSLSDLGTLPRCISSNGMHGGVQFYKDQENIKTYGPILTFAQFAAMFDVELKPKKTLKLTDDYTATVDYTSETVQVGCQTIKFETVNQLHKLINE